MKKLINRESDSTPNKSTTVKTKNLLTTSSVSKIYCFYPNSISNIE